MKKSVLLCVALALIVTISCGRSHPRKLISAAIYAMPWNVLTRSALNRQNFMEVSGKAHVTVSDGDDLLNLERVARNMRLDPYDGSMDVRSVCYMYYSDKSVDTLCLGGIGMSLNGRMIRSDKDVALWLSAHLPKEYRLPSE